MPEFDSWSENHPWDDRRIVPYMIDKTSPLNDRTVKVLMPKGSLLVWDSRLPHQNFPNQSSGFRMVLYLTFSTITSEELEELQQQNEIKLSAGLTGDYYPTLVPNDKRRFLGLPNVLPPLPSELSLKALQTYKQAGLVEADDPAAAAMLYRKAFKLNPELEKAVCL